MNDLQHIAILSRSFGQTFFRTIFILLSAVILTACPGEDQCDDLRQIAWVPDLLSITPLHPNYAVGDEIMLSVSVMASNDYFGSTLNLFDATGDNNATLILTHDNLYSNNEVEFVKGSQDSGAPNWFNMEFNPENGKYELVMKIKLNRVGVYEFVTREFIEFRGAERCNRYRLDSSIEGNDDYVISFTVL